MATTDNILQAVQTYNKGGLAVLQNSNCFMKTFNTKFKDFPNIEGQLGATVTFDAPPRFLAQAGLVVDFQAVEQRKVSLTLNDGYNVPWAISANQLIEYDLDSYMKVFGMSAMAELGAYIEKDVARNCIENHVYRYFGSATTAINSYTQLAQGMARMRNFGAPKGKFKMYLPTIAIPGIIGNGLGQFVPRRNDDIADTWELGEFGGCQFYESNMLPSHVSGTVGNSAQILTVVSISGDGLTLTCSGATASDTGAIKSGDLLVFSDGISGKINMRYKTWTGHVNSSEPVQIRATADVSADGSGNVAIPIFPALISDVTNINVNINTPVVAGMKLTALPNHSRGLLLAGDAGYIATPALPEEVPYPTSRMYDPETGVGLRSYYGSVFGQNKHGFVQDAIWGSTMKDEYAMGIIFPDVTA